MPICSYVFGIIVALISYIVYYKYANVYSSIVVKPSKRYDYIIVGAGTTGCVLAARLSEDPKTRVLLVEAGDHMGYFTKIPLTATASQLGPNDWSVRTTRQKYSSFGLWEQTSILPRGKGLGGSGQINFLLHGLGLPQDYLNWAKRGWKGWTLEKLRPYFVKAFGSVRSEFDSNHCSLDGYCPGAKARMKLTQLDENNELLSVFKRASSLLSDDKYTIFRKPTATIKDGKRFSSYDAYLKPVLKRKNLHVLLNTQAVSIRFENTTASSVYILQNHRELNNIFVNKEVIVCAGAIQSPQLLILSGIGPKELIKKLRIKLVAENSHVGRNLHDHMNMPIYVSIQKPISITLAKVFSFHTVWDYYWKNQGMLAFPPVAGVEYQNSSALMLFSMGTASEKLLRDLSNYHPQVFRDTFPFHNDTSKEGFMFLASCVQPTSRGYVTLRDSSTSIPPLVNTNYLHQGFDVRCMIKALRRAEQLIATEPFKNIGARIHWPRPERCRSFWNYTREDQTGIASRRKRQINQQHLTKPSKDEKYLHQSKTSPKDRSKDSSKKSTLKDKSKTSTDQAIVLKSPPDAYLECILREVAVTGHHVGGTCAGGTVVDDELRVKSVTGLRVMDASVLPSPLSLFPNSVLIAMAERAADIIRNSVIQ